MCQQYHLEWCDWKDTAWWCSKHARWYHAQTHWWSTMTLWTTCVMRSGLNWPWSRCCSLPGRAVSWDPCCISPSSHCAQWSLSTWQTLIIWHQCPGLTFGEPVWAVARARPRLPCFPALICKWVYLTPFPVCFCIWYLLLQTNQTLNSFCSFLAK